MFNRITIADVAREVGVSMMTVSRVINDRGDVSPETRAKVRQAIKQLGYRPSGIARGLATQHTGTVGLVVPDIANPFFAEIARGVALYSKSEIRRIKGRHSNEIDDILGYSNGTTVIHRNDMVRKQNGVQGR